MDTMLRPSLQPSLWYRFATALGLIALCLALFAAQPSTLTAPRATPQLLQLAADQPASLVSVVVQKATQDAALEHRIIELGGTITANLPIVNGLSARMIASTVPILARDANVRWISLDAPLVKQACSGAGCIDPAALKSVFNQTIGASALWNQPNPIRGSGIGVAVLDSGGNPYNDLYTKSGQSRLVASVAFNEGYNPSPFDSFGHGNQVIGIIGSNGSVTKGAYMGVAPEVKIINVKISDDRNQGTATTASMLAGMQWIYDNKAVYNIRVVNISLTDSVIESYHVSPLSAAAERLWQRGIIVVVAAGNGGANSLAAPANDPFVITVGAADDRGTVATSDDTVASWSSYGRTVDGFAKPDLVAPGVNLVVPMPVGSSFLSDKYPGNVVTHSNGARLFRMSGTSVAAPVVAGAVALLLQSEPNLTPNQVKYRLMATARTMPGAAGSGAGMLNIQNAVAARTITGSANGGLAWSSSIGYLASDVNATAKWSTAKWSTAKWSTAKWSTMRP